MELAVDLRYDDHSDMKNAATVLVKTQGLKDEGEKRSKPQGLAWDLGSTTTLS